MDIAVIIIVSAFVLYFLIMIPIQYSYIAEMKELKKRSQSTHNEMYEKMPVGEEQLHYNLQGNLLNIPSNLVAMLIYKIRNREE